VYLAADSASSSGLLSFLPIILIVVAMYFLLIRPQNKRKREAAQMQSQLGPGDQIQTVGGLFATVVAVDDEAITVEPSPGVRMRFAKGAVGRVITSQAKESDDSGNSDAAKTVEQG